MKGQITITKKEARLFLLSKQMLLPSQSLSGYEGIGTVFDRLGLIQYDPLNICARNPDLVLQSRVSDIKTDEYNRWIYEEKKGIEFRDKELCIVKTEDLPYCSYWYGEGDGTRTGDFLFDHKKELDALIKRISDNGPVSSLDLEDDRKADIWWGPATWSKSALDSLWRSGRLVIAFRKNGRKYYDLPEKAYGRKLKFPTQSSSGKNLRQRILRRLKATGMLPASGTGTGWLGIGKSAEISGEIANLIKRKELEEVQIEGVKRKFVILKADSDILKTEELSCMRMVFLAPLDNLLWDRKMIKEIFDFEYTWEVYVPEKKRKFGYYVLPILYGDRLIGRIEPVFLKDKKVLEIRNIWLEPEVTSDDTLRSDLEIAVKRLKEFIGAKDIKYKIKNNKQWQRF